MLIDQDESPFHAFVAEGVLRLEENILTKNIWLRKNLRGWFPGFGRLQRDREFQKILENHP